jgi:hypothetical protein
MAGFHDDPTAPYGPRPSGPPDAVDRSPSINATRLWSGGLATAVVAALIALVGVLIVRALLRIDLYAPRDAGAFGSSDTAVLCATAAVAALVATGLAHLLLLSTPRPLTYFSWIVGLVTAAAVVSPFTYAPSISLALTQAVIHLVVGAAIGSLVSGAAANASRPRVPYRPQYDLE